MARARLEAEIDGSTARFDIDYEEVEVVGPEQVAQDPGGTAVARLNKSLNDALASARPAAEAVIKAFEALEPDEVQVDFGLRVDAEAGAVFAKAGLGAHFTVSLKWTRAQPPGATPDPQRMRSIVS